MSAPAASAATPERPHRALVGVLLVLATVLAIVAIVAVWAQRQALSTDNWTKTSSELLENPTIRTAVADYLVDEVYANVDVQAELQSALPPQFQGLAGPAAGGLHSLANDAANEALQRPRVQAAWETANRNAHRQLLNVLENNSAAVETQGGAVTLDLGVLLKQTAADTGFGSRIAGKLPPGSGQIVILRSDQLSLAQDVTDSLKPLAIVLTVLSLALYAIAIWLGRGRRRQVMRSAGFGLIIAGVAVLAARSVGGNELPGALTSTASVEPAIAATWDIGTSLLASIASATIAYGVVLVLAAWLAGPMRAAVAVRRFLAPVLAEPGYAYGGLAVIVLLLLWWGPTQALRQPVTALILIVLLAFGLEVLRRQVARQFPDVRGFDDEPTPGTRASVDGLGEDAKEPARQR
jgi:hypothetical protein